MKFLVQICPWQKLLFARYFEFYASRRKSAFSHQLFLNFLRELIFGQLVFHSFITFLNIIVNFTMHAAFITSERHEDAATAKCKHQFLLFKCGYNPSYFVEFLSLFFLLVLGFETSHHLNSPESFCKVIFKSSQTDLTIRDVSLTLSGKSSQITLFWGIFEMLLLLGLRGNFHKNGIERFLVGMIKTSQSDRDVRGI